METENNNKKLPHFEHQEDVIRFYLGVHLNRDDNISSAYVLAKPTEEEQTFIIAQHLNASLSKHHFYKLITHHCKVNNYSIEEIKKSKTVKRLSSISEKIFNQLMEEVHLMVVHARNRENNHILNLAGGFFNSSSPKEYLSEPNDIDSTINDKIGDLKK